MKIIVSGGLGNQMFQYALYFALKERDKNVIFDTSLFNFTKMHNGYELERCFGLNVPKVRVTKCGILKLRFFLKYKPKSLMYNDKLYYDDTVFKVNRKYLSGTWQSEKYFKQIETKLHDAFSFKNIDFENQSIANEIKSVNSISLHIRQGDYVNNSLHGGICTEEYYLKAINRLVHEMGNEKSLEFYVFSDDKKFAIQFISKLNIKAKIIDFNIGRDSYKDMYLMSQCKHNIIANSSFSWWGAWLNICPGKIVIAPKRWFGGVDNYNYKDIVPETWIKI
jgi:hypothetical protein